MPPTAPNNPLQAAPPDVVAGSTTRSVVSYLLFLHFFILLVGIKSNTSSSGFDQDMRNKVPGVKPYLQLLAMDLSYMFHLTYYSGGQDIQDVQDTDYFIEADIPQSDGSSRRVAVDSSGRFPPIRSFRYRRLAYGTAVASEAGNPGLSGLLARAVARRMMLENNCTQLTLHYRRRLLQNLMLPAGNPQAAVERGRDPDDPVYFEDVYQTLAFLTADGELEVNQPKAAFETAAPAGAPAATAPTPTAPQPTAPAATGAQP